ncbi:MAG: hypothetical protein ACI9UT_000393 [Flavobacteriales bacterium]|jgi:hypothetical protein
MFLMLPLLPTKFFSVALLFFTVTSFAKPSANIHIIDQLFTNAASEQMVPCISVTIAGIDGLAWSKGYGYADL